MRIKLVDCRSRSSSCTSVLEDLKQTPHNTLPILVLNRDQELAPSFHPDENPYYSVWFSSKQSPGNLDPSLPRSTPSNPHCSKVSSTTHTLGVPDESAKLQDFQLPVLENLDLEYTHKVRKLPRLPLGSQSPDSPSSSHTHANPPKPYYVIHFEKTYEDLHRTQVSLSPAFPHSR